MTVSESLIPASEPSCQSPTLMPDLIRHLEIAGQARDEGVKPAMRVRGITCQRDGW